MLTGSGHGEELIALIANLLVRPDIAGDSRPGRKAQFNHNVLDELSHRNPATQSSGQQLVHLVVL